VLALHSRAGPPGEWGDIAVEAALPSSGAGERFTLELSGASGQSLTVENVRLPRPDQPEKKEEGGR
jgi:hypothetical protein